MKKLLCFSLILALALSLESCNSVDKEPETVTREIDRAELLSVLDAAYIKTAEQSNITYEADYGDYIRLKYGMYVDGKYLYEEQSGDTVWLLKENDACFIFSEVDGEKRKTTSPEKEFDDAVVGIKVYMFNSTLTDAREIVAYTDHLSCVVSTTGDTSKYSVTFSQEEKNYEMEIVITSGLVVRIEMFDVTVTFTYSSPQLPNFDDYTEEVA